MGANKVFLIKLLKLFHGMNIHCYLKWGGGGGGPALSPATDVQMAAAIYSLDKNSHLPFLLPMYILGFI